jgi:hypothetical protein
LAEKHDLLSAEARLLLFTGILGGSPPSPLARPGIGVVEGLITPGQPRGVYDPQMSDEILQATVTSIEGAA